jgi:hypothetical protein
MRDMTRRSFIGGAAALAAGAAGGVSAAPAVRRLGPVRMSTFIDAGEPFTIPAWLFADERAGKFGLDATIGQAVRVEFPLAGIRAIVASPSSAGRCGAIVRAKEGTILLPSMLVANEGRHLAFRAAEGTVPVRLLISDVQGVI